MRNPRPKTPRQRPPTRPKSTLLLDFFNKSKYSLVSGSQTLPNLHKFQIFGPCNIISAPATDLQLRPLQLGLKFHTCGRFREDSLSFDLHSLSFDFNSSFSLSRLLFSSFSHKSNLLEMLQMRPNHLLFIHIWEVELPLSRLSCLGRADLVLWGQNWVFWIK